MVSNRCKLVVKSELHKHGLHFTSIGLGEVEIMEELSKEKVESIDSALRKTGLVLPRHTLKP
jgi:hypothetical protein